MSRTCARVWEVSAARDGRLGAAATSALAGHIDRCEDCRRERDALDDVRERLQEAAAGELDELSLRRLRARTLEAAGNARLAPAQSSRPVVLLVAGALALGAIALLARPSPSVPTAPTARATDVTTTDEGGARWSAHEDVESRRIVLREGKVRLAVVRPAGGKRLVVEVPDGEIEDVGTTFHVEVADGHTRRVHVDEGSVVLRLDGQPSIAVAHGQTWQPVPRVAAEPPAIASAVAPPAPSARPAPRPSASASAPPARRDADDAGPEEEDRAYVEVVRLLREGREHEARTAAVGYLRRFPAGFRRAEVEKVLAP